MKQSNLSSTDFETGESSLKHYKVGPEPTVVDLAVKRLPKDYKAEHLRSSSGIKHVTSATVEVDPITGVCTGNGNLIVRLNNGETKD